MSMRRFHVRERSMFPTLAPGTEVVATDSRQAQIGDLVVFEHPRRVGFWLIKRRVEPPVDLGPEQAWVESDNRAESTVDSGSLGPIPTAALLPVVSRLDDVTFSEACGLLADEDDALQSLVSQFGVPVFWSREEGFATLARMILEQQVSLESGAAAYRRLGAAAGEVTPQAVKALGPEAIKDAGLTRQKAAYLTALALAVLEGWLDLNRVSHASVPEARAELMQVHGIGAWTAEVYLLAAVGHTDVFPAGDRALQVAAGRVLGLAHPPDQEELGIIAESWRPVRAAAARLLWHAYLVEKGRA